MFGVMDLQFVARSKNSTDFTAHLSCLCCMERYVTMSGFVECVNL